VKILPDPPERLLAKYEEILTLRRTRVEGDPPAPLPVLRRLARAFPGALRELDRLALDEIERLRAACERAVAEGHTPPELRVVGGYHALLREALRLKALLVSSPGGLEMAPSAISEDEELVAILRAKPRHVGRALVPLVAARAGVEPAAAAAMLFPGGARG
jgi:hypothetical protein